MAKKLKLRPSHSHLRTRVIRRIEEIPVSEWNKVFPKDIVNYGFYKTLEESILDQFKFFYILVYDRKNMVGIAPCFIVRYPLDTSMKGSLRKFTNSVKRIFPHLFSLKAVVCGAAIEKGAIGLSGDVNKVIGAIVNKMDQVAKKEKAPIIAFKDFSHMYARLLDPVLQEENFTKFDSLPYAEMSIPFKNFEEYLKTLSGASRYDLRRKFKSVDSHVRIEMNVVDTLTHEELLEIYGLYLQMVEKHEMGFELLPVEFFENISRNMPGQIKFFLWRINGKIAAFLLSLVSEDVFIDSYLGLDYALAHKYHLYFIKFRDAMEWCIKHKIKKYEMGVTGYEPKKRLGFEFDSLYLYVKYRNSLVWPFFRAFCQLLKFENFDPELKGLKKKEYT